MFDWLSKKVRSPYWLRLNSSSPLIVFYTISILQKLRKMGIAGIELNWFFDYFQGSFYKLPGE